MGYTKNPYGKPDYDDTYSFPQDSQAAVDFADEFANVRRGTSAERQSLPSAKRRVGMLWVETDTGMVFEDRGGGGWARVAGPSLLAGGRVSASTGGTSQDAGIVKVTHGMGKAPSAATATIAMDSPVIPEVLKAEVGNITATTFDVRIRRADQGNAPFSGNPVVFYWTAVA